MPTEAECHIVAGRIRALKAEFRERFAARGGDEKPQPRHLTPLQLAQAYRAAGRPLRPGLQAALDEHEGAGDV